MEHARSDFIVVDSRESRTSVPEAGRERKMMASNDKLSLVEHRMQRGWVGSKHSHPHDQIAYVVRGHVKVSCLGQTCDLRAGDSFVVRGGVEHSAIAVEDSLVIDVFTPCRQDY